MDNRYLIDFYNHYDEDSRLRLPHGTVEFLTTMHYIGKYLSPGSRVLEIGAGTGRYSHALAQQGYTVDAWSWSNTTSRCSARTPSPRKRCASFRATHWICPPFRTAHTISRCCSGRCTTSTPSGTSSRRCGRRSA